MSGASGGTGCPVVLADVRAVGAIFDAFRKPGPDVRAGGRISGGWPDVRAGGRMSGRCSLLLQGLAVWISKDRMSGGWKLLLPSSIGSLLPRTWGFVHLHVHSREGPPST